MSNFTFLKTEWPDVFETASKAESLAYPDARTACLYAQRASLVEFDALFASLQDRAFKGDD
jgi:type I restriction enzyme R subunit